ncbi:Peptide ABC transporter, ATP-binding protein [Pseudomonas savastanoi]|uniref:Peptide ABC transporter, ATP-binding protein n=2 Tax=Pseudomonas savastanoi TaxID=29438 RepID=A0A3M6A381_PSESS|nr:Peptide ABC transporter, ATP-binding protein [Pseudomonas savastanoi]
MRAVVSGRAKMAGRNHQSPDGRVHLDPQQNAGADHGLGVRLVRGAADLYGGIELHAGSVSYRAQPGGEYRSAGIRASGAHTRRGSYLHCLPGNSAEHAQPGHDRPGAAFWLHRVTAQRHELSGAWCAAARCRPWLAGTREHRRTESRRAGHRDPRAGHRHADHRCQPVHRPARLTARSPLGRALKMSQLIRVQDLRVVADGDQGELEIVKGVSFALEKGEVLALIGESGSGKTTIALALLGYARRGCKLAGGVVQVGEHDMLSLTESQLQGLRGNRVSYIAQSAAAAFNPAKKLIDQVIEGALIHGLGSRADLQAKAVELFRDLALPNPESIGQRYPHQVSGGQLQRVMAAMALISDPLLVILDEPTTALDVTTQIDVLRAFKRVVRERGATAVYVSHDLAVVAQMADQIVVLNGGRIIEQSSTAALLKGPEDAYTRSLLAAARPDKVLKPASEVVKDSTLLTIKGLTAGYGKKNLQGMPMIRVLEDIDLTIRRGQAIGVIGESGSGKSTLARVVAGLLDPAHGSLTFDGAELSGTLAGRTEEQFRRIQMVFQNADTALNPMHSISAILARPLKMYFDLKGKALRDRIDELMDLVRLPRELAERRPNELSGGQKQRVNLARALAAKPDLILCDEVTSALDTVVGACILELLGELRRKLGVSYLFISHDISTVRALCDDIVVMYSGHKVEEGSREAFSRVPFHPYTDLLVHSVPELRQGWLETCGVTSGKLPPISAPANNPELCTFLNRCPARVEGMCNKTAPSRRMIAGGSEILCHRDSDELQAVQENLNPVTVGAYA